MSRSQIRNISLADLESVAVAIPKVASLIGAVELLLERRQKLRCAEARLSEQGKNTASNRLAVQTATEDEKRAANLVKAALQQLRS